VSAGLDPLEDQDIGPGAGGDARLVRVGDRHPYLNPGAPEVGDDRGVRAAEGERRHRRALAPQQLELGLPVVIVGPGLSELGAVACGLVAEAPQVRVQRRRVDLPAARHEQVDPERRLGLLADLGQLGRDIRGAPVAGGEEAQPTGARDGEGELGGRWSPGQRGLDDGMGDPIEDHRRTLPGPKRPPGCAEALP